MYLRRLALGVLVLAGIFGSQQAGAPGRPSSVRPPVHAPAIRPKPAPERPTRWEHRESPSDKEAKDLAQDSSEPTAREEGDLLAGYEKILTRLASQHSPYKPPSHDAIRQMAGIYAEARRAGKVERLKGDLSWLSMRVTDNPSKDTMLTRHTHDLAEKYFSRSWSHDQIRVLATGLSHAALMKIEKATNHERETLNHLGALKQALAARDTHANETDWRKRVGTVLGPFKGKLLILVAHHTPGENFSGGQVLVQDGRTVAHVPVDTLITIARAEGVNLFLLGCSTAESASLGTYRSFSAEEAIVGIEKIFAKPIASYGQVYERLVRGDLEIVFDIALAAEGIFEVLAPRTGEPVQNWMIPDPGHTTFPPQKAPTGVENQACANRVLQTAADFANCSSVAVSSANPGGSTVPVDSSRFALPVPPATVVHPSEPVVIEPFWSRLGDNLLRGLAALVFTAGCCGFVIWIFASKIFSNDFSPSLLGNDEHNNPYSCMMFIYIVLLVGAGFLVGNVWESVGAMTDADSTPLAAAMVIVSGMVIAFMPLRRLLKNLSRKIREIERATAQATRENLRSWTP